MNSSSNKKEYLQFIKEFSAIFIPFVILSLTISIVFYFYANKTRRTAFRQQELFIVDQQEKMIHRMTQSVISDLQILAAHYTFQVKKQSGEKLLEITATEFQSFSIYKKVYDQLRILDQNGMEKVRVDRKDGKAIIIPAEQLQNKSKRYYFTDVIALDPGEIFASPLDLNIEHGVVEIPHKPTIRVGTPLFDKDGVNNGAILINYTGQEIDTSLDDLSKTSVGDIMLLNAEGYWLRSDNPDNDWGFMFKTKLNQTLGHQDKTAWDKIQLKQNGQFFTQQGLYTFTTIFPFCDHINSSDGSGLPFHPSTGTKNGADYSWRLISFVTTQKLINYQHPYLTKYIFLNLALVILIGYGCWSATSSKYKKRFAEQKLRQLATIDTLTDLPNRNLLYDRLSQALARAKRNQTMFAIIFLDLNHFKEINDTLGHKAGDKVLKEVASRMKEILRNEDTVARMGGDEFVVILNTNSLAEAKGVLEKLVTAINQPIKLDAKDDRLQRQVGVSGGISMYPEDGFDSETLLAKADIAMYKNKHASSNR